MRKALGSRMMLPRRWTSSNRAMASDKGRLGLAGYSFGRRLSCLWRCGIRGFAQWP